MTSDDNNTRPTKRMPAGIPVILSGFICPGLGQFVQSRRLAGTVYLALSAAAVAWFLIETLPVIRTLYVLAFADIQGGSLEEPQYSIPRIVAAFVTMGVIWLVNLFDVFYAVIRQRPEPEPPTPPEDQ